MNRDPLLTALLDLDAALDGQVGLCVGGGYGLFLKQLHLQENRHIKTLFPVEELPPARTTQDIDLILRAEIVTDSQQMKRIREALDALGFKVVETAKFMQFYRKVDAGGVKIDLLAGSLGQFKDRVPCDPRRIKPQPSVQLHARKIDEAVGVEEHPLEIEISGTLSSGRRHAMVVRIPQAFSYLLMKLGAFRDRLKDADKELGRHHALDIFRIVGLLTEEEDAAVRELCMRYAEHPVVIEARELARHHFIKPRGIGRIRIREHQLAPTALDLDRFADELRLLLSPRRSSGS